MHLGEAIPPSPKPPHLNLQEKPGSHISTRMISYRSPKCFPLIMVQLIPIVHMVNLNTMSIGPYRNLNKFHIVQHT